MPKPGAKVPEGTRVTLIVSNGPRPVVMPNFVSMPVEAARALANRLGITLDTSQSIPGMPPDTIASQNIAQGTPVDRNAIVRVVVNSGMPNASPTPEGNGPIVSLPNVVGQDYDSARQMLTQAGLQFAVRFVAQSANNGRIVEQTPPAGQVPQGSPVVITLSVSGEVPDTGGMTTEEAIKTLRAYGYSVARWEYTTAVGADGKVVGTEPSAGTPLSPGSSRYRHGQRNAAVAVRTAMPQPRLRILGIDPALRTTGYGAIERCNGRVRLIEAGVVVPQRTWNARRAAARAPRRHLRRDRANRTGTTSSSKSSTRPTKIPARPC